MRRQCPEIAVRAEINTSDHLMDRVEEGSLDAAVLYAAPRRPGIVAELLFEEKLVHVRAAPGDHPLAPDDDVHVDWGEDFEASHRAAFPDKPNAVVTINYGPLALEYILATGGSGYLRRGTVAPLLADGRLLTVENSPEFSYSAYAVYSAKADQAITQRIRAGLRASAEASL
jgi:DNA-binding transcriptional LysR family regulator